VKRREFMRLLGGAAAWPLAARAQQPAMVRQVGVLMGPAESDPEGQSEIVAFRQGLQKLGWTGRNVRIAYRWAAGDADRMRTFASELIALKPDAVLAVTTPAVAALLGETRSIPIVFVRVADPIRSGFVNSLAHPGGNVSGFSNFESSLAGKWLQLLKEIAPRVARVTVMFNPVTAPSGGLDFLRLVEAAAPSLAVEVSAARVHDVAEIERVVAAVAREPNGGLINLPDIFLVVHRELIIELTARYRVPTVYQYRYFTASGGLMSYGPDVIDQYAQAASYVDRILKGEKPSDLPVQAPTKYELVIQPEDGEGARSRRAFASSAARRRGDRMSNCHLVAARSLIDMATSRLALRAPALRAATALTRPSRSAQRLPCGRQNLPTAKTVGPNNVVANHCVEHGDHLTHHRHDHDLRQLAGGRETVVERLEHRIPIAGAHRRHVKHLADVRTSAPDAPPSLERAALEGVGRDANQRSDLLAAHAAARIGGGELLRSAELHLSVRRTEIKMCTTRLPR
jgi:putative tryptophan/tyrosine transport system substrate-binding protein